MPRSPNPKMEEARKLYKKGKALVEIAKLLDVPEGTIRRWKHDKDWDGKKAQKKRERSGNESNKNASVRKAGAPKGNKNAVGGKGNPHPKQQIKHGAYRAVYFDTLDAEEQEMLEEIPKDEELLLIEQIQLFSIRERRIMQAINVYRNSNEPVAVYGVVRTETKRSFADEEEEAVYKQRMEEDIAAKKRLPGRSYDIQTTTENKYHVIARLEQELSNVQSKKTKAIEALSKLHLEKQKLEGENGGNDIVKAWAEQVMKSRREQSS